MKYIQGTKITIQWWGEDKDFIVLKEYSHVDQIN